MASDSSFSTEWKLEFIDDATKTQYYSYFEFYPDQISVKKSFERDVKNCPYRHGKFRRIVKLEGRYKGLYRYNKSETRIIYRPHGETRTVYTYETSKVTEASYKRKNRKKNLISKRKNN